MATVEKIPAIAPEVLADLEAVCNTKGIVRDPKLLRWITERADQVRQETLKQFGVQEIGAEIIQRPDTGLKAPPALGGSAMVVRLTGRQIFAVRRPAARKSPKDRSVSSDRIDTGTEKTGH